MAVSQIYTAVANDVITSARWNNEFGNIYNNGTAIAFPLTTAVSFAGFTVTLDSGGATTLSSSASQGFIFAPGAKSGTPNTTGKTFNFAAHTFTDSATASSGTATELAFCAIQQPTVAASNTNVTTSDAATVYIANSPAAGTNQTITRSWALWVDAGLSRFDGGVVAPGFNSSIRGLTYANNSGDATNDLDMAAGGAMGSTNAYWMEASALTKQTDVAWAVGTNNGMLDTGVVGNSDYYIWLIARPDTGVVDFLSSLSSTAPTMPTSYTYKRLIGWFKRVGGTVVAFDTYETAGGGLELIWDSPTLDIDLTSTLTTSRRTDAVKVPLNVSTTAHLNIVVNDATAQAIVWIYCPDQADVAPSGTAAPLANVISTTARADVT
ncbi:MAG: hypothetical protein MN733_00095, partial [Nitrososphaera sp.]|nr:hypothetical protein [Nitrososphaera sp.]